MSTTLKFAARLLMVVALLSAVQVFFAPAPSGTDPYASALSVLTGTDAYAAGCSFRTCLFRGERLYCVSTTIADKCAQKGTNCTSSPC